MRGLPKEAWVLVCDGQKALYLKNAGTPGTPRLEVFRKEVQDNPKNTELATDAPGRRSDGPSGHKSAMEPTDFHGQAETRFAGEIAAALYSAAHAGEFAALVLVAAPQVLGDLRAALHGEVRQRILGEVPKTLTNHPVGEIEAVLAEHFEAAGDGPRPGA